MKRDPKRGAEVNFSQFPLHCQSLIPSAPRASEWSVYSFLGFFGKAVRTDATMSADRRLILCGVIDRKERWGLTWRGRLLLACLVLAFGIWLVLTIHPFLAPTQRVPARLLVIEGWTPPATLRE